MATTKTLGEAAQFRLGLQASADPKGGVPMIRVGDLKGPIDWTSVDFTSSPKASDSRLWVMEGDVLIARSGDGSVGNLQVALEVPKQVTFASYVIRVRPESGWDGRYLAYWLKTQRGRTELESRIVGSPIRNLSIDRLANLPVPVQRYERQVAVGRQAHEAYLTFIETQTRVASAMEALAMLRPSSAASLSDFWNEKHPQVSLPDITQNTDRLRVALNSGERQKRRGQTPYYGASGVIDHVSGHTHEGKHLLISEDGNNLRTRKTPIAFVANGRFWANNHVHVLKVDETRVLADYLVLALDGFDVDPLLTGSAQPKLNQRALGSISLPLPNLADQRQIISASEEFQRRLDDLRSLGTSVLANLNAAWTEVLEGAYEQNGQEPSGSSLQPDEALNWLEELEARGLLTKVSEANVQNDVPGDGAPREEFVPIESVFRERHNVSDSEEVGEAVDQFFEWLRIETRAGRLTIRVNGGQTMVSVIK